MNMTQSQHNSVLVRSIKEKRRDYAHYATALLLTPHLQQQSSSLKPCGISSGLLKLQKQPNHCFVLVPAINEPSGATMTVSVACNSVQGNAGDCFR
jgi:hypothetical protein